MKSNTNFTSSEIFNGQNDIKEDYIYEEHTIKHKVFKFKYAIVFLLIVAVFVSSSLLFNKKVESENNAALYQETSATIDKWMKPFEDIGNNTLQINHEARISEGMSSSIALSELQNKLEKVNVQTAKGTVYLKNVNIILKKGKSYEIVDSITGEELNSEN